MHVLIIPSWYPRFEGDPEGSFFRDQAHGLTALGLQVGVAFADLRGPLRRWHNLRFGMEIRNDGLVQEVRSHGFNWFPRFNPGFERLWLRHFKKAATEYVREFGRPDILHVHSMEPAAFAAERLSRELQIPYIITEHSTAHVLSTVSSSRRTMLARLANSSATNIAVSEDFARKLNELYGGNWIYLPNIVAERFLTHPFRSEQGDTIRLVSVGYLTRRKRMDLIIEALALLLQNGLDVELKVIGDGPERGNLERLASDLVVADRVLFEGQVQTKDMPAAIADATILVSASEFETFGVTLIEAMALGLPVVATRSSGPLSIVNHKTGKLVNGGNSIDLFHAISQLISELDKFRREDIRRHCTEIYSPSVICRNLKSIYATALADAV